MPLPIVPLSLFNAEVLAAADTEPHAQRGNHIRLNTHPRLGLPVAPFIIWRFGARDTSRITFRNTGTFIDSHGRVLTPPFNLTVDNPVVVHIPLLPGERCVWANVLADPSGTPAQSVRREEQPRRAARSLSTRAQLRAARSGLGREVGRVRGPAVPPASGMIAEAFVSSALGPASVGMRDTRMYAFSAPGLIEIRLTGSAAVKSVQWIEGHEIPNFDFIPWRLLALPHRGGPRYLSVKDALARAALRVIEQAPKRQPLQDTLGAVAPAAAPAMTPADEARRVSSLSAPLTPDLDALITDMSESPLTLRVEDALVDEHNETIGSADQRRLDRLFQAQLDPGCAALLGYKAHDRDFTDTETGVTFYWITGFFRDFPSDILPDSDFDGLIATLDPQNIIGSEKNLVTLVKDLLSGLPAAELNNETLGEIERVNDYIGLGTLAVVDGLAPPLQVSPPLIDDTTHVGWMPLTPPVAKREVEVALSGVVTGGLLAAEKLTPATGTARESLNSVNGDGFHLPLVLGLSIDQSALAPPPEPGTGTIFDRDAAPDAVRYSVAQQDRFGRWSEWSAAINDPGPRPRPPRPVIRATYTQPADPATTGGSVRVQADVPPLDSLAPGSFPIAELRVTGTYDPFGGAVSHVRSVGDPLAPVRRIDFSFTGPVLAPTSTRKLRLTAVWRDINSVDSVESEPQTITMHDPRPPAQVPPPPDTLLYSGRPDIRGLSMVEYEWTPVPGQTRFAVYYTDENRLRAHLSREDASPEESTLLDDLGEASDAAARATLWRANPGFFDAHLFERLQNVVVDGASGKKRFLHAVSGSLRVLNIYRVAAEASTNAGVDLTTLPLIIYGVPNADPPARPTIEVVPGDMSSNADEYAAIVRITLTPGTTQAKTWRLRRSNLGATDALRMPIVTTGVMNDIEPDGRQRAEFTDAGPVQISTTAKLLPWVRYHWVAETQGVPAPGSQAAGRPVAGLWSQPSDPASLVLVPPQPPEAVKNLAVAGTPVGDGTFVDVTVTFGHSRALLGGSVGSYRARLERRVPDDAMEMLLEAPIAGTARFSLSGMRADDLTDAPRAGTLYRVVIIDPLGREGTPAEVSLAREREAMKES